MGPQGSEHAEQLSTAHRGSSAYCALWPKRKEKNYIYIYIKNIKIQNLITRQRIIKHTQKHKIRIQFFKIRSI